MLDEIIRVSSIQAGACPGIPIPKDSVRGLGFSLERTTSGSGDPAGFSTGSGGELLSGRLLWQKLYVPHAWDGHGL